MSISSIQFAVYPEVLGDDGLWNPVLGAGPLAGGLQISINASNDGYRKLATYFQQLADRDTGSDDAYHEHHGPFLSIDGLTRVHLICRKDDVRFTKPPRSDSA